MADSDKQSSDGGKPQPSGPGGENPSTAGKEKTRVNSFTPENRVGSIDPSAANDGMTAPSRQAIESDKDSNDPQ